MVSIQLKLLILIFLTGAVIDIFQFMDHHNKLVDFLLWMQWALTNANQVWFVLILYNQLFEWIVMCNLIVYQLNKTIGEITFEHNNSLETGIGSMHSTSKVVRKTSKLLGGNYSVR